MKLSKTLKNLFPKDTMAELDKAIAKREIDSLLGKDHLYRKIERASKARLPIQSK